MSMHWKKLVLWGGLLLLITVIAYIPATRGGFIWDDDDYVTENRTLRSAAGLYRIWFELGANRQYYPMTHTTFWVEYHLWELNPFGYHLVNVLLHGLGAVLLWLVLSRLSVPAAWLAAALFALHPVHVESVAWITERKNLLSGFLYLGSLLSYLHFLGLGKETPEESPATAHRPGTRPLATRWGAFYALSLLLYVCALLSKSVTCTLPVIVLLLLWWKRGGVRWRDLVPLAPFFVAGLALGLTTVWAEKHFVGAQGEDWSFSFLDRLLVAGRALWFYAGKLLWPSPLMFNYPRWQIDSTVWWQYLFPVSVAGILAVLWMLRRRIGKGPLVGVLFFAVTLAPALGFFDVYPMRFSFVADHFQYLASLGLIVLFVAVGATGLGRLMPLRPRAVIGAVLLLVLGALVWKQGYVYRDLETLWLDTIARNPSSWLAHQNLGKEYLDRDRFAEAVSHLNAAVRLKPDEYKAHDNLGNAMTKQGLLDQAESHYLEALRIRPDYADGHYNLGVLRESQGRLGEAAAQYARALKFMPEHVWAHNNLGLAMVKLDRTQEGLEHFSKALELESDFLPARINMGIVLFGQGRLTEAIAHFSEAVRLEPDSPDAHNVLGAALLEQGKLQEARDQFAEALRIDPTYEEARSNLELVRELMGD
jgi:tetratricopeptide (TPR) repeat protein